MPEKSGRRTVFEKESPSVYKKRTSLLHGHICSDFGKRRRLVKNTSGRDKEIAGEELIELAWRRIEEVTYMFGGMATFLEAEKEEKLLSFYRNNRFLQFDTRQTSSSIDEPHEPVQLLRLF